MGRLTLGDYVAAVESLIHDSTGSAWSRTEIVRRINDARKDASLDMRCVRSLVTGVQLIRGTDRYRYDGAVCGAEIKRDEQGSGYGGEFADVTFTPAPPGGEVPEAYGVVHDGRVIHIRFTRWGSGYTHIPDITITDPAGTGSGAKATAITLINTIDVMSIANIWNTMRYSLSYKSFTIFQAWARSMQRQGFEMTPGIFTIHQGDQDVYIQPTPNDHYESEWDVIRMPWPLVGLSTLDRDIADPWAQAVQFKAAAYLLMKHQTFGQAEYYERKYDARVPRIVSGAGGVRIANPYARSFFTKMRRA